MDLEKYRSLFLEEARQQLAGLAALLEPDLPPDPERANRLFRHAHSVKGMAAAMALEGVRRLANALEEQLSAVRSGSAALDEPLRRRLLAATDFLSRQIDAYEAGREIPAAGAVLALLAGARPDAASASPPAGPAPDAAPREGGPRLGALRVEPARVDTLLERLTGLLTVEGRLRSALAGTGSLEALQSLEELRRNLDELRSLVREVRLIPFDAMLPELKRAVREAAGEAGKQVRFLGSGAEASLDRGVAEALVDPLIHLIRNAVDHGIEEARERARAGKPEHGTLRLAIEHHAETLWVTLGDDGRGMDPEALKERALAMGVLDAEAARDLDGRAALRLALVPGLTTAGPGSTLSGRGVGLDAIAARVESLGGRLSLESTPGLGTSITLRVPRTVSLQRLFRVRAGGRDFALPLARIQAVLEIRAPDVRPGGTRSRLRLPGEGDLDLVDLARALALGSGPEGAATGLLVELPRQRYVLQVDEALRAQELVVCPLGRPLQRLAPLSGAALLEGGRLALVLDLEELYARESGGLAPSVQLPPSP